MKLQLCGVLGHRRHKKLARPHLDTWRSECVRCGVPMVRSRPGFWTAAPALREVFRSAPSAGQARRAESSTPIAADFPEKLIIPGMPPIDHLPFAPDIATAIMSDRHDTADLRLHYLSRSAECRRLAEASSDRSIELIHLDMATRYELLARDANEDPHQLKVVR